MTKTLYRLISFGVALALAFGVSSQALASGTQAAMQISNVYYVSTTGSDTNSGSSTAPFKTFAKAVSVLAPGATLQVMPGTYTEALILSKSGTAAAPITVIGNGAILNMKGVKQTGMRITGSYINVSNFEVTGATDAGIGIPGKYVTVKNNIVHDNVTGNGIGTCGAAGSYSSALKVGVGGERISIEGNTVYNNCGEGIAITRGVHVLVRNNTVYDNFAPNIYVDNSPFTTVENNLVYCTGARLRLDGRRPTAIGLGEEEYAGWGAQMHDVLITGNTVKGCGKGIGAFDSELGGTLTNITITKNYIPSGDGRAISITSELNRNMVISYNNLFNQVWLQNPVGITLIGNTVIGSTAPTATKISSPTSTKSAPTSTPISVKTATPVASKTPVPAATFTSTPVTIASQVPTNAPAATLTSTPPIVSTPLQSVVDPIFASSFESGGFSDWTGNANGSGDLSVSTAAALVGSNGLHAFINDGTVMYVNDDSPNAEPRYRARFYFDPNSLSMASGDAHIILRGYGGTSAVVLRVEFGFSAGAYQIRAALVNDGSTWTNTNWFTIGDSPHSIELDWRAATATGANNGALTLWIDGTQQADLVGVDNDTQRLDRVRLGALADIDAGTSGMYYFDAFESRRQSYIGP
ncbi:MAG: right-handed parallel beta-helix repeat-containing protein [Chloroflexota bacterium]